MSSVPGDGARCVSQLRVAGSCNRIGRITRGGGAPQLMMLRLLRMGLRVKLLAMGVMRGLLSSGGSVFYQGRDMEIRCAVEREQYTVQYTAFFARSKGQTEGFKNMLSVVKRAERTGVCSVRSRKMNLSGSAKPQPVLKSFGLW